MPPMSRRTKAYLLTAALCAVLVNPLALTVRSMTRGVASFLFGVLVLVWTETLRTRLSGKSLRRYMLSGAFLLFTLFPIRECRYSVFRGGIMEKLCWYGCYPALLFVPLLFFFAALCVDRREEDRPLRYARLLWIPPSLLSAAILTNDLHGLAFRKPGIEELRSHGPVYWIVLVWIVLIDLCAFGVLMRRCRRSESRRLWYVPVLSAAPAVLLILLYGLNGGASPKIGDWPIYQYQEAYALLYVCVWEACIQIGLIPTSADYDRIFSLSSVNAAIADMEGNVVYGSENAPPLTYALIGAASDRPVPVGGNRWLRRALIPGGSVLWCEDLSEILRLNEELERVNEELAARNAVLEAENELRQTRAKLEAANRLWDGIVARIRPQLRTIADRLEGERDEDLADVAFLGAYIKRRSNLALIAEEEEDLSTEELGLAVRESLAYLSLRGFLCDVREEGEARIPADVAEAAYDAFEDAAEAVLGSGEETGSLLVTISAREGFSLAMLFDTPAPGLSPQVLEILAAAGLTADSREEDGAGYLCLTLRDGADDGQGEGRETDA